MGLPIEKAGTRVESLVGTILKKGDLKIGNQVRIKSGGGDGSMYIITDILGEGKFKAVPKSVIENAYHKITYQNGVPIKKISENLKETFDISVKKSPYQLGIFLSDRVKSIIKGESPTFKKSGNFPKFEVK